MVGEKLIVELSRRFGDAAGSGNSDSFCASASTLRSARARALRSARRDGVAAGVLIRLGRRGALALASRDSQVPPCLALACLVDASLPQAAGASGGARATRCIAQVDLSWGRD